MELAQDDDEARKLKGGWDIAEIVRMQERSDSQQLDAFMEFQQQLQAATDHGDLLDESIKCFQGHLSNWRAAIDRCRNLAPGLPELSQKDDCEKPWPSIDTEEPVLETSSDGSWSRRPTPSKVTFRIPVTAANSIPDEERQDERESVDVDHSISSASPFFTSNPSNATSSRTERMLRKSGSASFMSTFGEGALELHPVWASREIRTSSLPSGIISHKDTEFSGRFGDALQQNDCVQMLVDRPSSIKRILWEVSSVILLLFDIITLPLQAFHYDRTRTAHVARYIIAIFWMIDIIYSFWVGYPKVDGRIELRLRQIASRYIRTWFIPDVILVLSDWIMIILDDESVGALGMARIGKGLRATRFIRMIRIMRIFKLVHMMQESGNHAYSGFMALMNAFRLLLGVSIVAHFLACFWYLVGTWDGEGVEGTWVYDLANLSMPFRYFISFHWVLAQFTPAPSNYHPVNMGERIYAICTIYVGWVLYASFLGSVTSLITQARKNVFLKVQEESRVREFLNERKIPLVLGKEITNLYKEGQKRQHLLLETDVPLFKDLPESILQQLRYNVYGASLKWHVLFDVVDTDFHNCFIDICHQAVSERCLAKRDELFQYRQEASMMYYLMKGEFHYFPKQEAARQKRLKQENCICEAILWVKWQHRGLLVATGPACIMQLDNMRFRAAVARHARALVTFRAYSQLFVTSLLDVQEGWSFLDDLFQAFTIKLALEKELAMVIAESGQEVPRSLQKHVSYSRSSTPP